MQISSEDLAALHALKTRSRRIPLIDRPGIVAVVSGDRTTYPQFSTCVATLNTTPGSALFWQLAGAGHVAAGRNELVRQAFAYARAKPFWLWFIDDDHVFPPDVLAPLLRHNKDVLVPTVLDRTRPHRWSVWETFDVEQSMTDEALLNAVKAANPGLPKVHVGQVGPIEVGLAGTGGMLISSEVLAAMPDPWFEFGKFELNTAGEDTWFCAKARRLGFRIYCDTDTPIGHLTTCAVWPEWRMNQIQSHVEVSARVELPSREIHIKNCHEKIQR